jgi:lysyl-tRNA synthetase class 1
MSEPAALLRELAEQSNAWPFEEARKIVARLKKKPKDEVLFETGYGRSCRSIRTAASCCRCR